MTFSPILLNSVEQLGYRVTVGDVTAQAGLDINLAQRGLLALASDAGGHMQVSDTGEIVYLFPKNFRSILRNKYWKIRLKEWWDKVWKVLFYLIRISFGIVLILSIILMVVAIFVIITALSSSRDGDGDSGSSNNSRGSSGPNLIFLPNFWLGPDLFWVFEPDYESKRRQRRENSQGEYQMNFLEAIFSFIFGDGNPNDNLEERRWQDVGTVIRNQGGAVVGEQIAPYLDEIDAASKENEDYMLPALIRFNGYPQVSPQGSIIYYFPDLQVTAKQRQGQSVSAYLREQLWRFSQAGSGQIMLSIGLGALNIVLALILGALLKEEALKDIGGFIGFVDSIYWLLLSYGIGFLGIPLGRYFWLKGRNKKIADRNSLREQRALVLNQGDKQLLKKINYARRFAADKVITSEDISYSTETDLLEQEIARSDKIDEEWQRRLDSSS
jgi:hypothetical protein